MESILLQKLKRKHEQELDKLNNDFQHLFEDLYLKTEDQKIYQYSKYTGELEVVDEQRLLLICMLQLSKLCKQIDSNSNKNLSSVTVNLKKLLAIQQKNNSTI